MRESVDHRVLGAFRCVDAITGNSVAEQIPVSSTALVLKQNRRGIYVAFNAPGMDRLTTQFLPSTAWPAATPFEVSLRDPSFRYLPRRAQVSMPRALKGIGDSASVLNPQDITLYRGPAAPVAPNWAVIHCSVVQAGTAPPVGLPWAVLRVLRTSDNAVLATGAADARGEALLAIAGLSLQVNSAGGGAVLQPSVGVTVQAYFDPQAAGKPASWIPNPDDILNNVSNPAWKTASSAAQVSAGTTQSMVLTISV